MDDPATITRENLLKHLVIVGQRMAGKKSRKKEYKQALEDFRDLYLDIKNGHQEAGAALATFYTTYRTVESNMISLLMFASTVGLAPGTLWAVVDGDLVYIGIQEEP